MSTIGRAELIIVPRFDGLSSQMNRALSSAARSSSVNNAGTKTGSAFSSSFSSSASSGIVKSGAIFGAVSQVTSKAMDVVAEHMDAAVSRLDTLKNYSRIMQSSFGVDAEEAQKSIDTMADRLSDLPTRLDTMASTVSGLYAATKDYGVSLTDATNVGLGLNDMLLAGGQSQSVVNAASEQFRQILAKGKPDLQDWRALLQAAPGQMDQLAKYMLGASGTATQLYYALGGGNEKTAAAAGYEYATLSLQDLLAAIVTLDTEGGAGLDSFQKQAEAAQGGIQTAMDNMGNAVTKGLANVMDSIGRENIVSVIDGVKGKINDAFSGISDFAKDISPDALSTVSNVIEGVSTAVQTLGTNVGSVVKTVLPGVKDLSGAFEEASPIVGNAATAFLGLKVASGAANVFKGAIGGMSGTLRTVSDAFLNLAVTDGMGSLSETFLDIAGGAETMANAIISPVGVGVVGALTLVGGVVATLAAQEAEAKSRQDDFNSALSAFNDVVSQSTSLDEYNGRVDSIGTAAERSTEHLDNLTSTLQSNADTIRQNNEEAETSIGTWQTIDSIIDDLGGRTDLTVQQQGQLKWALEQLNEATGETISQEDVLTGKFTDQAGAVQDLKSWVDQLAQSKINEARTNALQKDLETAYSGQRDAAAAVSEAYQQYNDVLDEHTQKLMEKNGWDERTAETAAKTDKEVRDAKQSLDNATAAYNDQTKAVSDLEGELGGLEDATSDVADAYSKLAADPLISGAFGSDTQDFVEGMREAGVSLDDFNAKLKENPQLAAEVARAFDGTKASIVRALSDAGVQMDQTGQDIVANAEAMQSAIEGMDLSAPLETMGTSAEQLANRLQDAGISAETIGSIGAENFANLASSVASAGGTVDDLVDRVQDLNALGIADKEFTVRSDGLIEVEGHVVDLQNMTIDDKHFTVNDDGTISIEGQQVQGLQELLDVLPALTHTDVTDDGTASTVSNQMDGVKSSIDAIPKNPTTHISATDSASGVIANVKSELNALDGSTARVHITTLRETINTNSGINVNTNTKSTGAGALKSAIRSFGFAQGGIFRERDHADGYIARERTVYRDVVGENGAEAIIPLTNRHYSQPFADIIADGVLKRMGESKQGPTYVANVGDIVIQATTKQEFATRLADVIGDWEGLSRT